MLLLRSLPTFFMAALFAQFLTPTGQGTIPPEWQVVGSLGVGGVLALWSMRVIREQADAHKRELVDKETLRTKEAQEYAADLKALLTQAGIREDRQLSAFEQVSKGLGNIAAMVEQQGVLQQIKERLDRIDPPNPYEPPARPPDRR